MKLHVPIPRWFLVLAVAGLVLAGALAVVAPFAVYTGVVLGLYTSLFRSLRSLVTRACATVARAGAAARRPAHVR